MEGPINPNNPKEVLKEGFDEYILDFIKKINKDSRIRFRKKAGITEVADVGLDDVLLICKELDRNGIGFNLALAWNNSFHEPIYYPVIKYGTGIKKPLTINELNNKCESAKKRLSNLFNLSREKF